MNREFRPLQAEEIARAFQAEEVEYEKVHSPPLRSAGDITSGKIPGE